MICMGTIDLKKYTSHYEKLKRIFERTLHLIDHYQIHELAIESPFYGKNIQSMLKLGRAQGVAMSAALSRALPIFEYAPRKIKLSISGQGNASKEQIAGLMKKMHIIRDIPGNLDATDGLATAICHHYQNGKITGGAPYNSWEEYIRKNPGRVR